MLSDDHSTRCGAPPRSGRDVQIVLQSPIVERQVYAGNDAPRVLMVAAQGAYTPPSRSVSYCRYARSSRDRKRKSYAASPKLEIAEYR